MIISENNIPSTEEFAALMRNTDKLLNSEALRNPDYYKTRVGNPLEDDVVEALTEAAKGTPFDGTIQKISGQRFPDIIAARYYGIEVKSTKENHWTSTGSSILETTKLPDVKRIYMTFGKLGGNPIEFTSKPYEECLYGIAVTHMPRYLINMRLQYGESIFDKMGIQYSELSQMDNPIPTVANYYKKQLKKGESLWWAGEAIDENVSPTLKLWETLSKGEQGAYIAYGYVNYPEIMHSNYGNFAIWLSKRGVVHYHLRDSFSASGRVVMRTIYGEKVFSRIYSNIEDYKEYIIQRLKLKHMDVFDEENEVNRETLVKRLFYWKESIIYNTGRMINKEDVSNLLQQIFKEYLE